MAEIRNYFGRHQYQTAILGGTVVLSLLSTVATAYIGGDFLQTANVGNLLAAVLSAQAGLLAIVFSLMFVGVQLTSHYSSRMTWIFTEHFDFRMTFFIVLGSIFTDMLLLGILTILPQSVLVGGGALAIGLTVLSFGAIYSYIETGLERTTPDGILSAYRERITPESYLDQVKRVEAEEPGEYHPMQELREMVMSALSKEERTTAGVAAEAYSDITQSTLEEYLSDEPENTEDNDEPVAYDLEYEFDWVSSQLPGESPQERSGLFDPVLTEHLPEIAFHAADHGEQELAGDTIRDIYQIGELGIEAGDENICRGTFRGLRGTIPRARSEGHHTIEMRAWRNTGRVLRELSKRPAPALLSNLLTFYGNEVQSLSYRELSEWPTSDNVRQVFSDVVQVHENVCSRYGGAAAELEFEWGEETPAEGQTDRWEVLKPFDQIQRIVCDISEATLRQIKDGHYPITEGNFRHSWKQLCIDGSTSPVTGHALILCRAMIETGFIGAVEANESPSSWGNNIGRVMHEGDASVVEEAFEEILSYDSANQNTLERILGRLLASEDAELYTPLVNYREYRPLNTHPQFPELVIELRDEARETNASLQDE